MLRVDLDCRSYLSEDVLIVVLLTFMWLHWLYSNHGRFLKGLKGVTPVLEQWPNHPNLQKELRQNLGIQRNAGGRKGEWSKKLLVESNIVNRGVWDALSTIWTTEKVCARIMIANWIILNSQIPLVWCVWCAIVGKRFLQLHICGWNLSRHSFENSIACAKCYYCPVTNRIVHGDVTLLVSVAQQISTRLR